MTSDSHNSEKQKPQSETKPPPKKAQDSDHVRLPFNVDFPSRLLYLFAISLPKSFSSRKHLTAGACVLVVTHALLIATIGHRTLGPVLCEVAQLALGLICILVSIESFQRSHGVARYAWRLIAITFSLWAVAQTLAIHVDLSASPYFGRLADRLFFLSIIPLSMLSFLDPEHEPNSLDRLHILDFVQVCIFAASIFLAFSPRMWSAQSAFRLGHFTWSRNLAFDGLLVVTFVLRALLTKRTGVRSLFGRMAIFLLLSGLADSYALSPEGDLQAGGWFDLIRSALLLIPILIATTWRNANRDRDDPSRESQTRVINQVFPLLYPLFSFLILARVHQAYPVLAPVVFALAFATVGLRMVVIQHRQTQSDNKLRLDIEVRKDAEEALRQSEIEYRLLFNSNPIPMWVFNRDTLKFLEVNEAAIHRYGYSEQEFMKMTIADIRPEQDVAVLVENTGKRFVGLQEATSWRHRKKDGTIMDVEIVCHDLHFHGIEGELVAAHDVTERNRSAEMLQNSENKYRVFFEDSADAVWLMDEKGFLECNLAALEMFGYSSTEMIHPADISPASQPDGSDSRTAAEQKIAAAFQNGKERFEWLHKRKNGDVFPAEVRLTALTLSGQPRLLATVRDITELRRAETTLVQERNLLRTLIDNIPDYIYAKDTNNKFLLANVALARRMGAASAGALVGKSDCDFYTPDLAANFAKDEQQIMQSGQPVIDREESTIDAASGQLVWHTTTEVPLRDQNGNVVGLLGVGHNITERKRAEERAQFFAYHDALTGLPNRALLQDRLNTAIAGAQRRKNHVALLFLDLDRFKLINDSLGHAVGDILLQEVAKRFTSWVRGQDTVARLGGDEFLIVLNDVENIPDVAIAAERLMDVMNAEFVIQDRPLSIGCSLGISIFPEHGADAEALIKNADAAMYSAKEAGRNNFRFFTEDMNAQAAGRLTLENSLRMAMGKEEFFLVYQPQINMVTGKMIGMEALLRWQHPTLGVVPPDEFIPIAENIGLIVSLGEWVLRTACGQARKWQNAGLPVISIAVNISAVQFRQAGFCDLVRKALRETGLAPQYLELELTESLLLADAGVTLSVIQELKVIGLTLTIDDFGTGYSSFSYLKQFRASKLKIDRSFIRDVALNPDDAAITAAIISMAKSLKLKVIAEGVEDEAQMSFLRSHECDEIQGYFFSKPLTAEKAAEKLRDEMLHALSTSAGTG